MTATASPLLLSLVLNLCSLLPAGNALAQQTHAATPLPNGERATSAAGDLLELDVTHAAFAHKDVADALVHIPANWKPSAPLNIVVFLHGWNGCARVLMHSGKIHCRPHDKARAGWGLAERHGAAATPTLLIVPQLSLLERSGSPGQFKEDAHFKAFLSDVLGATARALKVAPMDATQIRSITLVAHSAGFEAALAILAHGSLSEKIRHVVLLDSLYAHPEQFSAWLAEAPQRRRLVSVYQGNGTTARMNRRLQRLSARYLPSNDEGLWYGSASELPPPSKRPALVVARSRFGHEALAKKHFASIVAWLDRFR